VPPSAATPRRVSIATWLPLLALAGLGCDAETCPEDGCGSAGPASCDVAVAEVHEEVVPGSPESRRLGVRLDEPAAVAVACTRSDLDTETLLWESEEALEHSGVLSGLLADRGHDCRAAAVCNGVAGPTTGFSFRTPSPIDDLPTLEVQGEPPGAYLLLSYADVCGETIPVRLLVLDPTGRTRWTYTDIPTEVKISIGHDYLGDGRFFWGGGEGPQGAPQIVGLDQQTLYATAFEGSQTLDYHHEARHYDDGSILTLATAGNSVGEESFRGFVLHLHDAATGEVTWTWNSQLGVDQGMLQPGMGDVFHANWADIDPEARIAYVSLCAQEQIIAVDMDTDEVVWRLGAGGDFELVDTTGKRLLDAEWPQCVHGAEVVGGRLLVYDNGVRRLESRVTEMVLDTQEWTATQTWTWTEEGFFEKSLGDADYLDDGTVLVGKAHVECLDESHGHTTEVVGLDPESGETPWRMTFSRPDDTIYRAEVIDACDVFPNNRWCPEVASRLDELGI